MSKEQSILTLLSKYRIRGKTGAGNISIRCPLAPYSPLHKNNYDSRPSMGIKVNDDSVLVNCFTCQFKAGQLSYLFKRLAYFDSKWKVAVDDCLDLENAYLGEALGQLNYHKVNQVDEIKPYVEDLFTPYSRKFSPYLFSRGITLETGKRFGVGFDEDAARVIFPVRDPMGRLWGAVGRTIKNEKPKYLNYWEMSKGQHLLGSHLVESGLCLIVVEGALDCMILDQFLYCNGLYGDFRAVSIMGASMTKDQADKIVAWSNQVIIALDNDEPGRIGTKKAIGLLSTRMQTKVGYINRVGKKDFGECSDQDILSVIDNATLVV